MGWFHDTFGFSSQDVGKKVGEETWNLFAKPVNYLLHDYSPVPTWEELQRPGQWFADHMTNTLGKDVAPYAGSVISLFNPFVGAAYTTAYNAGKMQETQKGMDWGEVGKDAAVNFGTAAVADWAKNTQAASTQTANTKNALEGFNAGQSSALASSAVPSVPSASSSLTPTAYKLASSGMGELAKQQALKAAPQVANQALTATLTPAGATPISGVMNDPLSTNLAGDGYASKWGDVLSAFGGSELTTANLNGPRINQEAFNQGADRLAANAFLQQNEKRDRFIPAGQTSPTENTPYGNQLDYVQKSTDQAYKDYADQVANYNRYYGLIDANPGRLDETQMNAWIQNPETVPTNLMDYFQGLKPIYY